MTIKIDGLRVNVTKKQFQKSIKSMKRDISKYLEDECLRLFSSGGIDTTKYIDACLTKMIMNVALKNCAQQYWPHHNAKWKREIRNQKSGTFLIIRRCNIFVR